MSNYLRRKKKFNYESGRNVKFGEDEEGRSSERLYTFGDFNCSDDEINTEELDIQLQQRTSGSETKIKDTAVNYVEHKICLGDTLRGLALKYNVTVAMLKQTNNLISDQDFYALTQIKIPLMIQNSLRLELASSQDDGAQASCSSSFNDSVRLLSIGDTLNSFKSDHRIFFTRMDADLERIRSANISKKHTLDQVTQSLTNKCFHPLTFPEVKRVRIKPWLYLIVVLIILIGLPALLSLSKLTVHHHKFNGTELTNSSASPSNNP